MRTKIILEMCANHNGDFEIAKEMVDQAAELKVYGVKFQKRDIASIPDDMVNPFLKKEVMFGDTWKEDRAALEFDISQMAELKNYAESKGLVFSCTAFDEKSIHDLANMGCGIIKLPSQLYLQDSICKTVLEYKRDAEIHVSTGMHTWKEIKKAYWFYNADVLYHCLSIYPGQVAECNLITLQKMCQSRNRVGYSSHEIDGGAIYCAVLIGAGYIERHFTLDKNMKGADHQIASNFRDMESIIESVRLAEIVLGNKDRPVQGEEKKVAEVFRCL